jgi:hypothetical protein
VRDVAVTDAHDLLNNLSNGMGSSALNIPPIAPVAATVSFDIVWSGVITSGKIIREDQNYRGSFVKTGGTIDWSTESSMPGGFAFQSEMSNPARNRYSIIAHERNGAFFRPDDDD